MPLRIGEGPYFGGNKTIGGTLTITGQLLAQAGGSAAPAISFAGDPDTGFYNGNANRIDVACGGGRQYAFISPDFYILGSGGGLIMGSGNDVILRGDASNRLGMRNGTASQLLGVYNTYTDASNYERLTIKGVASAAFQILSEAAGTGTVRGITIDPGTADIQWGKALVALGGGSAPTLGTIGSSGPATAGQNSWLRVLDSAGAACWLPVWK